MPQKFNNLDELNIYLEGLEKRVKYLEEQKEIQDKKIWDISQMAKGKFENLDLIAHIEEQKNQRSKRSLLAAVIEIGLVLLVIGGGITLFLSIFR